MEAEVLRMMDDLTAAPDLATAAVATSNESKDERLRPLRDLEADLAARLRPLDAQVTNLVDVLKQGGAVAFASVHDALKHAEADRATVECELARHREAIREVARSRADPDRVLAVLDDFRLGYELARPAERRELIRALFKRIEYLGPGELLRLELFDRNAIPKPELKDPAGSNLPTGWLPAPSIHRTWVYERAFPRKRLPEVDRKRPRRPRDAMARRRREFEAVMAREGISRAELARRLGCSRAWVTRVLGPSG